MQDDLPRNERTTVIALRIPAPLLDDLDVEVRACSVPGSLSGQRASVIRALIAEGLAARARKAARR